jgi:hypothetical protein
MKRKEPTLVVELPLREVPSQRHATLRCGLEPKLVASDSKIYVAVFPCDGVKVEIVTQTGRAQGIWHRL